MVPAERPSTAFGECENENPLPISVIKFVFAPFIYQRRHRLTLARMTAMIFQFVNTTTWRSEPHSPLSAAKCNWNQWRKYFRSPPAKWPYNFGMKEKNACFTDTDETTPAATFAASARTLSARCADFKCASHEPTERLVWW
jgi:hypothetical protein